MNDKKRNNYSYWKLTSLRFKKITNLILDNFKEIPAWHHLPKLGFFENMYIQYS